MGLSDMIIFWMREKSERIDREDEMGYFNEKDNEKDRKSERRKRWKTIRYIIIYKIERDGKNSYKLRRECWTYDWINELLSRKDMRTTT